MANVSPALLGAAKPIARAFALAYLSATTPRLLSALLGVARGKRSPAEAHSLIASALRQALEWNRFPAFCAFLIGGSSALQLPFRRLLRQLNGRSKKWHLDGLIVKRLARFLAALLAAAAGFEALNSRPYSDAAARVYLAEKAEKTSTPQPDKSLPIPTHPISAARIPPLAGYTLPLTLFAFTRALDTTLHPHVPKWTPAATFALSSAAIMHAFFYTPNRLPPGYARWISLLADLDQRLIKVLREARYGNFVYGKDTGIKDLLGSFCRELGLPEKWGDPAVTIPIPCLVVHQGECRSCERNAIKRALRAARQALSLYLPLQIMFLILRRFGGAKIRIAALRRLLASSARSAAFLGSFVGLFWYGVCLARTRVGPKLLGRWIGPQAWDGGLCIAAGCLACGGSVLIEDAARHVELSLFVLPRALGIVLGRFYERKYLNWERGVFCVSAATLIAVARERPERVRGVFGKILQGVLEG
ncbi:hypothetical protein EJ06DRAFT_5965 [Trichodelitschia bisporula]|uniref:Integral membrane protein n=1 Tax=Trichodelitschia bisporula TaxID=703511 RepID=A0A6G1I9L0_9PEZI|nr:hypothetical protein EJ06DRAFT_5965 [Trichodelitschia bisporula]